MEIETLEKKKMDVIREVANSNVLVASMKAELLKLEQEKELFFNKRENEVSGRIHKLLNNSRILLEESSTNYQGVHEFYELLKKYSDGLFQIQGDIAKQIKDFMEASEVWGKNISQREKELSDLRRDIYIDKAGIEKEKELLKKRIIKEKENFNSQQESIKKSYNELQHLWEKLQKTS